PKSSAPKLDSKTHSCTSPQNLSGHPPRPDRFSFWNTRSFPDHILPKPSPSTLPAPPCASCIQHCAFKTSLPSTLHSPLLTPSPGGPATFSSVYLMAS